MFSQTSQNTTKAHFVFEDTFLTSMRVTEFEQYINLPVKVKTAANAGLLVSANIEALSVRICVLHILHPEEAKIILPL